MGIKNRTTTDIDFSLENEALELENVKRMINDIISVKFPDYISYEIRGYSENKKNDSHSGFKVSLVAKLENIRSFFSVDIASGDVITPKAINYEHETLLKSEKINLISYNIETILAEKFQTIIDKKIGNSRNKDFYDIYIIMKLKRKAISDEIIVEAVKNTFKYRETPYQKDEVLKILDTLTNDRGFQKRWKLYTKKNVFANDISFSEAMDSVYLLNKIVSDNWI